MYLYIPGKFIDVITQILKEVTGEKSSFYIILGSLVNEYLEVKVNIISAGEFHSIALQKDGFIVSWGNDYYKQVSDTPTENTFIAISASGLHSMALRKDGSIVSWGSDRFKQVSDTIRKELWNDDFIAISVSTRYSMAL